MHPETEPLPSPFRGMLTPYLGSGARPDPWTCWVWDWSPGPPLSPFPFASVILAPWPGELLPPVAHPVHCGPHLLHTNIRILRKHSVMIHCSIYTVNKFCFSLTSRTQAWPCCMYVNSKNKTIKTWDFLGIQLSNAIWLTCSVVIVQSENDNN